MNLTKELKYVLVGSVGLFMAMSAQAYEKAFAPTSPGEVEIKTIPALTAIVHEGKGEDYFEENGDLFMPLFRYIQKREIAMTTPVESSMSPVSMSFYIGSDADRGVLQPEGAVAVKELPERVVLAVGIRGSYSKGNYETALEKAKAWLGEQSDYEATGSAPRMIYWNGPYIPWFLKQSELHVDVRKRF